MRSVNKICMSVLMLGAAAIAAPAVAQSVDAKANTADQATPTEQAAAAGAAVSDSASSNQAAADNQQANADTSAGKQSASSAHSQTAMTSSSGDAAANANVSSVGDTSKKYHRSSRAKDDRAEQKITQQLNQQAAAAAKPGVQTALNQ